MNINVAVAIVIKEESVLVVKRRKKEGKLEWQFPAGKIYNNELPQNAAKRECLEETNVLCRPYKLIGKRLHPDTQVNICYWLCEYVSGDTKNLDKNENKLVKWMAKKDFIKLAKSNIYPPLLEILLGLN